MFIHFIKLSYLLVITWLLSFSPQLGAVNQSDTSKQLRMAVIYNYEPPFFYVDENHNLKGILANLGNALSRELELELVFVPTPRKGLEQAILSGKADIAWMSVEWVANVQQMIFSESAFIHKDFLYSLKPFDNQLSPKDWLKNKTVCVRQDYVYPVLFQFFAEGYGEPTFVSTQVPLLRLLEMGRCDLLLTSEHRVNWMKCELNFTTAIWQSPLPIEETGLTFMLHKNNQDFMPKLNQALAKIKQSGELGQILQSFE